MFIKKSYYGFAIVTVYVDDINLIRTLKELEKTVGHLKSEFEMKDLGKLDTVSAWRSSIFQMVVWFINQTTSIKSCDALTRIK